MRLIPAILGWLLACFVSLVAALLATLGVARLATAPTAFLGAGWAVLVAGIGGSTAFVLRRRSGRTRLTAALAAATAGSIGVGLAILLPLGDPRLAPAAVTGMRRVVLSTGSRIAYVRVPGEGNEDAPPILFIHGGPGVADMATDVGFFAELARDGHDVIAYDQVGAGHSDRLADPAAYTLDRDLADLEALIEELSLERPVLIGHSYGSTLAAAYLAKHPAQASGVVFLAPGAIRTHGVDYGGGMVDRLSDAQQGALNMALFQPRALVGWLLSQVNPGAAVRFAGDAEMDARFDRLYAMSAPGLVCDPDLAVPHPHGLGFYTNAAMRDIPDLREALGNVEVPALILKPQCDYLLWTFGTDLAQAIPGAELVYVRGAGHSVYVEQPEIVRGMIRAFLGHQEPPLASQSDLAPPADLDSPVGSDE